MTLNRTEDAELAAVRNRIRKCELRSRVRDLVLEAALVIGFLAVIFSTLFGITFQKGNDMYPAIRDGDMILYFRRGDLLPTQSVVYEADGEIHCGRIAAAGGTEINRTRDNKVTVDGIVILPDPDRGIYAETFASGKGSYPVTVKRDQYFILNDDRTRTDDSRTFGSIGRSAIKGRITAVIRMRQI